MNQALKLLLEFVESLPAARACSYCKHWDFETCRKFNETPPSHIQESGCPAYEFDPTTVEIR